MLYLRKDIIPLFAKKDFDRQFRNFVTSSKSSERILANSIPQLQNNWISSWLICWRERKKVEASQICFLWLRILSLPHTQKKNAKFEKLTCFYLRFSKKNVECVTEDEENLRLFGFPGRSFENQANYRYLHFRSWEAHTQAHLSICPLPLFSSHKESLMHGTEEYWYSLQRNQFALFLWKMLIFS